MVVGTRTRGDGDGVAPYLVRLPETGLLVRFSTTTCANEDGTLNTVTGHAPDFMCKPKETALARDNIEAFHIKGILSSW